MESTSGRKLVTVASFDERASHRGDPEVEQYAMTEEPVDYSEEWGASRVPSNITLKRLGEIRERYCVLHYVEMLVLEAHERPCYPRPGCVAVSEYLFKAGMRLPLHPFFRTVLRNFMLSPTQVLPNGWS